MAAPLERRAGAERSALVPGGLDQQPACVCVAGLGDRAQPAALAGRVLARRQAEERAERLRPESLPVAQLDRQGERGQRGDTTQTDEPAHDLGKGRLSGELDDRDVECVTARLRLKHRPYLRRKTSDSGREAKRCRRSQASAPAPVQALES